MGWKAMQSRIREEGQGRCVHRVDEAGEKGIQHPQTDPITTLGTLKGPAGHKDR